MAKNRKFLYRCLPGAWNIARVYERGIGVKKEEHFELAGVIARIPDNADKFQSQLDKTKPSAYPP